MAAFKNKDNGTWYVQFRYTDWKGERQQKLKRGFATKREALEWEREFLMEKQADVNMTFESFVALYEKDIKPKLKLNTWRTKESIIQKKILPPFLLAHIKYRSDGSIHIIVLYNNLDYIIGNSQSSRALAGIIDKHFSNTSVSALLKLLLSLYENNSL